MLRALELHFRDLAVWNVPSGGFYIWCRMKKQVNMEKIFQKAKKEFLLLNPGNIYDFKENHALRLSYAYAKPEDVREGIRLLAGIIKETMG